MFQTFPLFAWCFNDLFIQWSEFNDLFINFLFHIMADQKSDEHFTWCYSVSDTGLLGKRKSEYSCQELNLRPSDY